MSRDESIVSEDETIVSEDENTVSEDEDTEDARAVSEDGNAVSDDERAVRVVMQAAATRSHSLWPHSCSWHCLHQGSGPSQLAAHPLVVLLQKALGKWLPESKAVDSKHSLSAR